MIRAALVLLTAFLFSSLSATVTAKETALTPAPPFEGEAFVGVTDQPNLFVAIVIGPTEARAYLCDGDGLVTWLTGRTVDTYLHLLRLSADDGTQLSAQRNGENVHGDVTLADGRRITFSAEPATGIAGLYEIVVSEDQVVGAAAGGLRLEGAVVGSLSDGTLLIGGAVALPSGELRPVAVFATPDAAGEQRWIVLDDGRVTGAFKKGAGNGFIDPVTELAVPKSRSFIDPTMDN